MLVNESIVDDIVTILPGDAQKFAALVKKQASGFSSSNPHLYRFIDSYAKTFADTFTDKSVDNKEAHRLLMMFYVAWGMMAIARAYDTQEAQNLQGIKRCLWCGQTLDDKQLFCPGCNNPTVNILGDIEPPEPDPDSIRDDEDYIHYMEEQESTQRAEEDLPFTMPGQS